MSYLVGEVEVIRERRYALEREQRRRDLLRQVRKSRVGTEGKQAVAILLQLISPLAATR